MLVTLQVEIKKLLVVFTNKLKTKQKNKQITIYQVPENILICFSNETAFVTSGAIWVTTWLSLLSYTVILQNPSVLCTCLWGYWNRNVLGITTYASFNSLMIELISKVFQECGIAFGLLFWYVEKKFYGFPSSLSSPPCPTTTIALSLSVREPIWRFCHLLNMYIPTMPSGILIITMGYLEDPLTHCETDLSQNYIDHLTFLSS